MLSAKGTNKQINARCLIVGCSQPPQSASFYAGYYLCTEHRLRLTTRSFIECLDKLSRSKSCHRYRQFVRDIRASMLPEIGKQCSICTDIKAIEDFKIPGAFSRSFAGHYHWQSNKQVCRACYYKQCDTPKTTDFVNYLYVERLTLLKEKSGLDCFAFAELLGYSPDYLRKVFSFRRKVSNLLLKSIITLEQEETFSYALQPQTSEPKPRQEYNFAQEYISPEQLDRMGLKIFYTGFGQMMRNREMRRKVA